MLILISVLLLVVLALFLIQLLRGGSKKELQRREREELGQQLARTEAKLAEIEHQRNHYLSKSEQQLETLRDLNNRFTVAETSLHQERQNIEKLQERFRLEFKNLSQEIFQQKGKDFAELNKRELDQLIKPLALDIQEFKKRVDETNKEDIARSSELKKTIELLAKQNDGLSKEAQELTQALRGGSNKTTGDYGEILLRQLLESAGLQEQTHFIEQGKGLGLRGEEGNILKPDVLLKLPNNRCLIVDSKMSLKSYVDWNAASEEMLEKKAELEFIRSTKAHIDNLDSKQYPKAFPGAQTPDLVLLFIPLEHAFHLAVQPQSGAGEPLYSYAWKRGIVLVSPSTLLAIARTVAHIWQRHDIGQNAEEIALRAGRLYDKFVGFVTDLEKIEKQFETTRALFDEAKGKLRTGRGNLIGQVEKLKQLGAKTNKTLPESFQNLEEDLFLSEEEEQEEI